MKNLYFKGLVLIIFSFLTFIPIDQLFAQAATVGNEFWVGFMENNRSELATDTGVIVITANEPSEGVIQYAGNVVSFNIQSGQQFFHRITSFDILHRTSGQVENKGVHILSSGNISVYAFNDRFRSADGTVVLPVSTLGKDYYITSHFELGKEDVNFNPNINNESILLIIGVEDDTDIEITPKANTPGRPKDAPYVIKLNKGQSYQLKAREDLTGSRVRVIGSDINECKKIAVFGGNKSTAVGECGGGNDHLFQQAYPVNTWGNEFLHVPYSGRNSGEIVKVLASEDNTNVIIDGVSKGTINAGEFIQLDFSHTQAASINGSKRISVTSFAKSMDCNQPSLGANMGDPFMITYSPNQQMLREIIFNAIALPSIDAHFVNIITKSSFRTQTILDGQNIGIQFTVFPFNPEYSYARIKIDAGVHSLENPNGFIAYAYGFGNIVSYGYAVGASLENLNFEVTSDYDFEISGEALACLNQSAEWEINPENQIFQYFSWDFGDGSSIQDGKLVNHQFDKVGTYEVVVTASIGQDSCDIQEEIRFEVLVEEYLGEIIGSNSVCPITDEIKYIFKSDVTLSRIEWEVEGGKIIESKENEVTVLWGEKNSAAKVSATPYSVQGCPGTKEEMLVVINNQILPNTPTGPENICFDDSVFYEYIVAESISGRGYKWFIQGGVIDGSNENFKVQVRWTNPKTIGKIWYEEYSLINDDCAGVSPQLQVEINAVFKAEINNITEVFCFGEDTGRIEVNVTGGTAPYNFVWSHNDMINSPVAEDIPVGTYSVTVTDGFGCEIIIDNINMTESPLLKIDAINISPTTCIERADGEAVINIIGGKAPYTINHPSNQINGNEMKLFDLESRFYELEITDYSGCILPVSFTITSPLPLEVDVRIEKFACPGEDNGKLTAEPRGGTKPYSFTWDLDNSTQYLLQGVQRGVHTVTVVDNQGCFSLGTGNMIEADPIARMPTGFDPREGLFEAVANCILTYNLLIYNRWGELIYFGKSGWDGKVNQEDAQMGNYTYVLNYNYILNEEPKSNQIKGGFTLVR